MKQGYLNFDELKQLINPLDVLSAIAYEKSNSILCGKEIRDFCPIHKGDNQRSLAIDTVKKEFYCSNCTAKGDLIGLYAQSKNIKNYEAAKELEAYFHINETSISEKSHTRTVTPAKKTMQEPNVFLENIWKKATNEGNHSYFELKDVDPCHGIRYGNNEKGRPSILVPFRNLGGTITAIEYINEKEKGYATSSERSASFFIVDEKNYLETKKAYLAEGLATALTIYEIIGSEQGSIVVSCGPADNIAKVARILRDKCPSLDITVHPDADDAGNRAAESCKNIPGIRIIQPDFSGLERCKEDNDFNDLKKLTGIETVRKQLMEYTTSIAEEIDSAPQTINDSLHSKKAPVYTAAININKSSENYFEYLLENNSEIKLIEELKNVAAGLTTGYKIGDVDLAFPGGAISIIAAPTSHGKTTALINFSLGVLAENTEKNVYFFSCEESSASILISFINVYIDDEITKGNNRKSIENYFRDDSIQCIQQEKLKSFKEKKALFFERLINNGRLKIHYSDLSAEQLIEAIYFIKKNDEKVGMICIDYMQLLKLSSSIRTSRQEELKQICLMLKDCAVATGLPIVVAAQFNRTVVTEADLSPVNIGEAGDIERIASLILGMYNRNFEMHRDGNKDKSGKTIKKEHTIYFEILKGRKIGNGYFSVMSFDGNTGRIENTAKNQAADQTGSSEFIEKNIDKKNSVTNRSKNKVINNEKDPILDAYNN